MAMTNAERQKKFREQRSSQVLEFDALRNENQQLSEKIRRLEIELYHSKENYEKSRSISQDYSEMIRLYRHHLRELKQDTGISYLRELYPGI